MKGKKNKNGILSVKDLKISKDFIFKEIDKIDGPICSICCDCCLCETGGV